MDKLTIPPHQYNVVYILPTKQIKIFYRINSLNKSESEMVSEKRRPIK